MEVIVFDRDKFRRDLMTRASNFFSRKLRIRRGQFGVIIASINNMDKHTLDQPAFGMAGLLEESIYGIALHRHPSIMLTLQHLAHEWVHIKQLHNGELMVRRHRGKSQIFWKGEDLTHLPYHQRPWEIEAMQKEVVLTFQLIGKIGYLDKQ